MNSIIRVALTTDPVQHARLQALQLAFAQVCNALAPMVQQSKCWNRVALHHMAYKTLRERFPGLGSQMICNAIYSVSRSCRLVYQHPKSPFNVHKLAGKPLPRVFFLPQSPVYFDRHTLSLKDGQVSMFTLDGRMRFNLALGADDEQRFRVEKLREIVLNQAGGRFSLTFQFATEAAIADADEVADEPGDRAGAQPRNPDLPEYMLIVDDVAPPLPTAVAAAHVQPSQHP